MVRNLFFILLILIQFSSLKTYPVITEKPLYIVVTSFNNAQWLKKNLDSIFSQEYNNYRIIYVDDGSSDGTAELVEEYIQKFNLSHKITLIKNKVRQWKMKNIYMAYHMAKDWEIIVQVDGDDYLPHSKVFQQINEAYTNNDIWITYGKFRRVRSEKNKESKEVSSIDVGGIEPNMSIPQRVMTSNALRHWYWIYVPIRTFYAWLFKLVKLETFITKSVEDFQGQFYPIADDMAMMFPMLEMASENHIFCFPDLMYIADMSRPETDSHEQRLKMAQAAVPEILSTPAYQPLSEPIFRNRNLDASKNKATLLVFSNDPSSLLNYLHSIDNFVTGVESICVLFDQKDMEKFIDFFNEVQVAYAKVKCFDLFSSQSKTDFINYFNTLTSQYIVLADSSKPFKRFLDLGYCSYLLEKTFAYGFYFNLGLTKKPETVYSTHIVDDIYLWKFIFGKDEWAGFNHTNGALYRKNDLNKLIDNINEKGIEALELWKKEEVNLEEIGLFYQKPRIIS